MELILVTGASGKTGGAVVSELLSRGRHVRALVHRRDARSDALARAGAEVVAADVFDTEQLLVAMKGATRAYYVPPWHPYMIQSAVAFAVAARGSKLEVVVGLSQWLANPAHPALLTRQHWLVDEMFSMLLGIAHVVVNPGYFADNYLGFDLLRFAAHLGIYPNPYGMSRNAPPSNEDIARVVVAALLDPSRHAGRKYRPTGPALLSPQDIADSLGRVLGRNVRRFDMPLWMFAKAMRASTIPIFDQTGTRRYTLEHRRGAFEAGAPTSDVYDVTGRQPEDFETVARRYSERIDTRRTPKNLLRAIGELTRIGFTVPYDLDRFERELHFPTPPHPRLSADSVAQDFQVQAEPSAAWR